MLASMPFQAGAGQRILSDLKIFRLLLCSLVLVVMLAACVSAPVQEMSDARQTLQAAEATVAGKPSDDLRAARRLLNQAEQALSYRDFDTARHMAMQARAKAMSAMDEPGEEAFE